MPTLTLYNTLTKSKEPFRALDPTNVTFYTCGPTVYDDAHIGNFRAFLAADLLRRWIESPLCKLIDDKTGEVHDPLKHGPRTVRHVLNITDVGHMTDDDLADGAGEDKMEAACERLREAKKAGTAHVESIDPNDPCQIADFYTERFLEDARKLGLKVAHEQQADPGVMPRASDNVGGMKRMIESLASKGFAYRVGDAVYFDVQKFESYGTLSGNTLDKLKGGAGGRVSDEHQAGKRHPADFLLWKSDPSHLMKWPGPTIEGEPMPEGYPGWHIECSVMSQVLGETIDLHSGGEDNIFPHHECERAQSCCAHGTDVFARHWFHPRFLLVEGEKMSKSKGNFFTARELFDRYDPSVIRYELLKTHYRSNANFTEDGLRDSEIQVRRLRDRARSIQLLREHPPVEGSIHVPAHEIDRIAFARSLSDDLNVSAALAAADNFRYMLGAIDGPRQITMFLRHEADRLDVQLPIEVLPSDVAMSLLESDDILDQIWGTMHLMDAVLGVVFVPQPKQTETDIGLFMGGLEPDPAVIDKLIARRDAKKAKDFARSDAIRDELAGMGYAIKDVAGGKVEVSRA